MKAVTSTESEERSRCSRPDLPASNESLSVADPRTKRDSVHNASAPATLSTPPRADTNLVA